MIRRACWTDGGAIHPFEDHFEIIQGEFYSNVAKMVEILKETLEDKPWVCERVSWVDCHWSDESRFLL